MGRRDLFRHAVRDLRADLAAVGPVDLVAVVVLRIVGSREVETGHRVLGPNQIGELRRGPNAVEGIDPDAVVCKDGCGLAFDEDKAKEILLENEIDILVALGDGNSSAEAYGCDLTYDYVKINGDYRT